MNTSITLALLLPVLSAGLAAQDLGLKVDATTQRVVAGIDAAPAGHIVVLVLGMRRHPTLLPDGQMLGIHPDLVAGWSMARGSVPTMLHIPMQLDRDLVFHAQAAAFDPLLALDSQQFALSQVETVEVR